MKTLTLASTRQVRLSEAHSAYLSAAIGGYRGKAAPALDREAAGRGNCMLAAGLLDEAASFHAMAAGVAEQSREVQLPQSTTD
jgi:hypothetical protein